MKKSEVAWYIPGPQFHLSEAMKKFLLLIALTFVAGGLNAVIALIEGGSVLIPQEFLAYSGLLLAVLHTIYTIVITYKDGLED